MGNRNNFEVLFTRRKLTQVQLRYQNIMLHGRPPCGAHREYPYVHVHMTKIWQISKTFPIFQQLKICYLLLEIDLQQTEPPLVNNVVYFSIAFKNTMSFSPTIFSMLQISIRCITIRMIDYVQNMPSTCLQWLLPNFHIQIRKVHHL